MTAQRLVRSGKARIFLLVSGVLLVLALIYHHETIVSELDNTKKRYETCSQQTESLSTNLQVIVDYKNKLEKTLQQEKSEHKQTRTELEAKINSEKVQRDKSSEDANKRYSTLQQHYKLLQAEHDDLKIKSDKQDEEIEQLQSKIKEMEEDLKQTETERQKALERLKNEYMQLQVDKENLEKKLRGHNDQQNDWESQVNHLTKERNQLLREINVLKNKPDALNIEEEPAKFPETATKNFNKQVEVGNNVYQIQDNKNNPIDPTDEDQHNENPNNEQNMFLKPALTSKSSTRTNFGNLAGAQPIILPTATPETKKEQVENSGNVLLPPTKHKKLPKGVVPIPNKGEKSKNDEKNIPDEVNLALPNRYINNIIESEIQNEIKETHPKIQHAPDENDKIQNNAQEVIDQPKMNNEIEEKDIKVEENEPKDTVIQHIVNKRKKHIDRLEKHVGLNKPPGLYENEADYDKDAHKEDLQIEENEQELEGEEDAPAKVPVLVLKDNYVKT